MKKIKPSNAVELAKILQDGGVVAVPTETVFGLCCSADSKEGVRRLSAIKNRGIDSGKIFTLVPVKKTDFKNYAFTKGAEDLIEKYVPGPITLLLRKNPKFKHFYFDNFDTVGLRIPDHELFEKLLPVSGPLLLTSANRRDEDTLESMKDIRKEFKELDAYVDQDCDHGLASVIVKVDESGNRAIIRRGALQLDL